MTYRKHRAGAEQQEARERAHEKLQAAMSQLEEGIGRIIDSESFAEYLRAMSRFYTYSAHNVALILSQRPDAAHVASYKGWQRLGRQVKKGERELVILVPLKSRITVSNEDGTEEERITTRFGTGHVFDIGQTEGEELPRPPAAEAIATATQPGRELYRRLEEWLTVQGVTVEVTDLGGPHGEYTPRTRAIRIDRGVDGTDHAAKTLAHEAAHQVAQHNGYTDRADAESVAEGAAYVVTQHYGIEASGYSFGYVAGWAEEKQVLGRNLEAISRTARVIIDGLEGAQSGVEEPQAA